MTDLLLPLAVLLHHMKMSIGLNRPREWRLFPVFPSFRIGPSTLNEAHVIGLYPN